MTIEIAMRLSEILLALAIAQHALEHLKLGEARALFAARLGLSALLAAGVATPITLTALSISSIMMLVRYQGPYNGGACRMGHLVLFCLCAAHWMPSTQLQELVLGYLALQLVLSYFISGWVKVTEPSWRSGQALQDVFDFSAYPASEAVRGWAKKPRLLLIMSWAVMVFELAFPLSLLWAPALYTALITAFIFHCGNAICFGLNRFAWTWLAAYPVIIWLQARVFESFI